MNQRCRDFIPTLADRLNYRHIFSRRQIAINVYQRRRRRLPAADFLCRRPPLVKCVVHFSSPSSATSSTSPCLSLCLFYITLNDLRWFLDDFSLVFK